MVYQEVLPATKAEYFYYPIAILFLIFNCLYFIVQCCLKRDNSWIDSFWGISFVIPNMIIVALRRDMLTWRMLLVNVPIIIWALRLSIYIFRRHKSEDQRYRKLREGWEAGGSCSYLT